MIKTSIEVFSSGYTRTATLSVDSDHSSTVLFASASENWPTSCTADSESDSDNCANSLHYEGNTHSLRVKLEDQHEMNAKIDKVVQFFREIWPSDMVCRNYIGRFIRSDPDLNFVALSGGKIIGLLLTNYCIIEK